MIGNLGKLEKMMLIAYADERFEDERGRYNVLINPESYTHKYNLRFDNSQGSGTSSSNLKYNSTLPEILKFDIYFDGTGALPFAFAKPNLDVAEEIETFKNLVLKYQGDIHQPYFVSLVWGTLLFKGRLKTLSLDYKLFNKNGKPLRVKASVVFEGSIEDEIRVSRENSQSPDITHLVAVKQKETIHQLANKVYKSPKHYLQVAQVNGLNHFRSLKTGQQLNFPPFKKENN